MLVLLQQPSRLDAETDFLSSIGPSCTLGTAKGEAQAKIRFCAKSTGGAYGLAIRQDSEARRLYA